MAQSLASFHLAATAGVAFCALFTGANLCISNIAVPTLLLPHPKPPTSETQNASKPISAIPSGKPATPSSHLARQWQHVYNIGSQVGPITALGGLASFVYAARTVPLGFVTQRQLLYLAAGLCVTVVPFTFVFMKSTNDELHRRANSAFNDEDIKAGGTVGQLQSRKTDDLIQRWSKLNLA